jgi:hypothetical protein
MKTAIVAEQWAQQQLISANQEDRDAAHMRTVRWSKASMLMASSALSHLAAAGRAMTTMSKAGRRGLCLRKDSLTRRLIRLRSTADLDTLRDTASPSRADGPGPMAATIIKQESPQRRPDLNTRPKSVGDSRRWARVKPWGTGTLAGSFLAAVSAERTSDSEAGAALGAPAGQHQPAALGGHAGTESVGAFPLDVARLIRAFHRCDPVDEGWRQPARPGPAKKTGNRTRAAPRVSTRVGAARRDRYG